MSSPTFRHRETRRVSKGFTSPRTTTGHGLGDYYCRSKTYMSTTVPHADLAWRFCLTSNPLLSTFSTLTHELVTFHVAW